MISEPDQLSQLIAENAALRRENAELQRQIHALAARCRELEAKLTTQRNTTTSPLPHPPTPSHDLAARLRAVRNDVLRRALTVPPTVPVPEELRRLSAIHLVRFYDAFADFVVDGNVELFNARREPLRVNLLDAGLPSEVALEMDRVIANELIKELPEYVSTIRERMVRSQLLVTETSIKRQFERIELPRWLPPQHISASTRPAAPSPPPSRLPMCASTPM